MREPILLRRYVFQAILQERSSRLSEEDANSYFPAAPIISILNNSHWGQSSYRLVFGGSQRALLLVIFLVYFRV